MGVRDLDWLLDLNSKIEVSKVATDNSLDKVAKGIFLILFFYFCID